METGDGLYLNKADEKEKQFIVNNGPANVAAEVVYRGARLVISRRGVREEIRSVEPRTVPQLVQVPVKLIRA